MKNLITVLFTVLVLVLVANISFAQEYQDVVYTKTGSIVRGTIIEQIPGVSLKIRTSDGSIFSYKMDEIEKISKETLSEEVKTSTSKKKYALKLGFVGGVNIGDLSITSPSRSSSGNAVFFLGGAVENQLSSAVSSFVNLQFTQKGATDIYDGYTTKNTVTVSFIEIETGIKVFPDMKPFKPFASLSTGIGIKVSTNAKSNGVDVSNSVDKDVGGFNFVLYLGAGADIELSKSMDLTFFMKYGFGATNLNSTTSGTPSIMTRDIIVGTGMKFSLN